MGASKRGVRWRSCLAGAAVAVLALPGCADQTEPAAAQPKRHVRQRPDNPWKTKSPQAWGASQDELNALAAAGQRQLNAMFATFNGLYSSIRVRADYPRGLEYVYVYSNPVDPVGIAQYMRTQFPIFRTTFRTQLAPLLRNRGVAWPQVTWTYRQPDGTLAWSRTFEWRMDLDRDHGQPRCGFDQAHGHSSAFGWRRRLVPPTTPEATGGSQISRPRRTRATAIGGSGCG